MKARLQKERTVLAMKRREDMKARLKKDEECDRWGLWEYLLRPHSDMSPQASHAN